MNFCIKTKFRLAIECLFLAIKSLRNLIKYNIFLIYNLTNILVKVNTFNQKTPILSIKLLNFNFIHALTLQCLNKFRCV